MGLQILVEASARAEVEAALGAIAPACEIFVTAPERLGLSIPTSVVDTAGEAAVRKVLASFRHFDLYEGIWREPKKKWRLW